MRLDAAFFRHQRGRLVASLTRVFGAHNLALAEDVAQETLAHAFEVWTYRGVPEHYEAALMTAAKNRAIDAFRRMSTRRKHAPALERELESEWTLRPALDELFLPSVLRDDELRMMFSICDPDLAEDVQVALILNILCGLTAEDIANVFLASTAAIEKRIARGKKVLASSSRLFELDESDFEPRLVAVRRALYVLFSEGYHGGGELVVREDLCRQALRIVMLLVAHEPAATPATYALAALMHLLASRLDARTSELGELIDLANQDRSRWDAELIASGLALLEQAAVGTVVSTYHLEATIAGLHASARSVDDTRWAEIVHLYDLYMQLAPSPVVALNRAIAIAQLQGPAAGLAAIEAIEGRDRLREYPFHAAACGELELRRGRPVAAAAHFKVALALARNDAEREYLQRRIAACRD